MQTGPVQIRFQFCVRLQFFSGLALSTVSRLPDNLVLTLQISNLKFSNFKSVISNAPGLSAHPTQIFGWKPQIFCRICLTRLPPVIRLKKLSHLAPLSHLGVLRWSVELVVRRLERISETRFTGPARARETDILET